ncbi:membrane protein DedA, SNARE-associated domain [Burkholderia sp. WP9]|uniref:bifunctional DedA family/phosphatase PAP2 family protein n=1 Tax=Burkholderia sp. WP9 TaxID=1500263 RepID=UPI000894AF27|nr:bifunctional DedA family/phosphatase PAP2 family protein [Burkholderia sp. WP9]SEF12667.1 membrane protein DedA, SNARE-associated domain [Burkholderia sp. WP9]
MEHAYGHLAHLLAGHPAWTLVVIFLAAFLEAVAVIGTVIPGSTVMFLGGALVGTGSLDLGWSLACALAGAVAGDGLSYWLGSRYRDTITRMWPFRTHPAMLKKGHAFFVRYGDKSIVFARFVGPLRAVVPVVAGMFGMRPARFYAMNVMSALVWAPAHILPGILFGASIQLAGAVSFRLVIVLAVLAGVVWMTLRVTRFLLRRAMTWASQARIRLSFWAGNRNGRLHSMARQLSSLDRTTLAFTVVASAVALLCSAVFFRVFRDVISAAPFLQIDVSVYRFMQSIRNPWSDTVLAGFATLSSMSTLIALVASAVCWMAWERRWRTVASWLGVVASSEIVVLAIQFTIHRVPPGSLPAHTYIFASSQVSASVIVYGFISFFIARRGGTLTGFLAVSTSATIVAVTAFEGLYFGRFWISDAVAGVTLALVWVAIIGIIAVWQNPSVPASRGFMPAVFLLAAVCSVGLHLAFNPPRQLDVRPADGETVLGTQGQWTDALWKRLPCCRADMTGERLEPFTVQWASTSEDLTRRLHVLGWASARISGLDVLFLVVPHAAAMELPVLPRLNNGVPSTLTFIRPGRTPQERDVLRFWKSGYTIAGSKGEAAAPLWVGSLTHERLKALSWPFNILRSDTTGWSKANDQALLVAPGVNVISTGESNGTPLMLLSTTRR